MGDKYGGQWVSERFSEHGVKYVPAELTTSDTYRECLPLFMANKAELLDHTRLAVQLALLGRMTTLRRPVAARWWPSLGSATLLKYGPD